MERKGWRVGRRSLMPWCGWIPRNDLGWRQCRPESQLVFRTCPIAQLPKDRFHSQTLWPQATVGTLQPALWQTQIAHASCWHVLQSENSTFSRWAGSPMALLGVPLRSFTWRLCWSTKEVANDRTAENVGLCSWWMDDALFFWLGVGTILGARHILASFKAGLCFELHWRQVRTSVSVGAAHSSDGFV